MTPRTASTRPAVGLRPATAADATLLAALHGEFLGQDWSPESMARLLALPGAAAWLASEPDGAAGAPVGYGLCVPAGETADLAALGVAPASRRRGIGRRLLTALLGAAGEAGFARMTLEVDAGNAGAIALYRQAGFAETGRRPDYYAAQPPHPPRDALIMTLELSRAR